MVVIHDLDSEAALDPARVGAKAAWLSRARHGGLPVLPGFVVDSAASRKHMALGADMLPGRGSGGARLAMTAAPPSFSDALVERAGQLGDALVARSSTSLEASGEWSGCFTSYLDVSPEEVPRAVTGCWASAFSVAALERQAFAGLEPGAVSMAVLIQPALDPSAGGIARLDDDGGVVVTGVKGSPAPLLQGWAAGIEARRADGAWIGDSLIELIGIDALDEIARALEQAWVEVGANQAEWALDGQAWILQLAPTEHGQRGVPVEPSPADPHLVQEARELINRGLLSNGKEQSEPYLRRGVGRWEPFIASVVLGNGTRHQGMPASGGVGAGVLSRPDGDPAVRVSPRSVLAAGQPVPNLAPLLWDAAAIVTETGSPAAHLFESARALRVPAVCGVTIPPGDWIVAVDGQDGVVATIPLAGDDDV